MQTSAGGLADVIVAKEDWEKSVHPYVDLHFAPAVEESAKFPWFNKPWSFAHWIEKTSKIDERTIALLDPDQFFLEALKSGAPQERLLIRTPKDFLRQIVKGTAPDKVVRGTAVAQRYGLGSFWTNSNSPFDRASICGSDSYCAKATDAEAEAFYSVGPPYIVHRHDFKKIVPLWWEYMRPVWKQDPGDIQADMYAYNMAAAHVGVKHVTMANYMVSDVDADAGEAWEWVDKYTNISCHNPEIPLDIPAPSLIHAASQYIACSKGEDFDTGKLGYVNMAKCTADGSEIWNFHKGHIYPNILACNEYLITPPPDNFFNIQQTKKAKRNAWIICAATYLVNDAALAHRSQFCENGYNSKKCMRLKLVPTRNTKEQEPTLRLSANGEVVPTEKRRPGKLKQFRQARIATELVGCS
jgi:hypothetical protein